MATAIQAHHPSLVRNGLQAMDGTSNTDNGGDSASITADDFLTLLVTEMQNQDPTANMDPNEYINQLVNVNSLQQLIAINQTLQEAVGVSPSGSVTSSGTGQVTTPSAHMAEFAAHVQPESGVTASPAGTASGNLSVPTVHLDAHAVANALSE
jgi:flagellar basal-body rod modification protein FlgD